MDIKLHEILATINFPKDLYPSLESCSLSRVKVNNKTMKIILDSEKQIPVDTYIKLRNCLNDFFNGVCNVEINVKKKSFERLMEYFNYYTEDEKYKFIKNRLKCNFNNYYIELNNESEKKEVESIVKDLNEKLSLVGVSNLDIIINEFNRTKVSEEIEKDKNVKVDPVIVREEPTTKYPQRRKKVKTVEDPNLILGELIEGDTRTIESIKGEEEDLIVDSLVFGCEGFESPKSDFKIITLKITDYTESMYAKIFTKDKDEYNQYLELFNSKLWFKIKGYTKIDQYAKNALVLNVQSINLLDKKESNDTVDDAVTKRCELHAHTKMSQMDGVADEVALVKKAMEWGHPGIAITDHDCCQSFPHVFNEVTDYNKGLKKKAQTKIDLIKEEIKEKGETKELKEKLEKAEFDKEHLDFFKVGYGVELSMCESYLNVCYNANDSKIKDNTFVVFDTETTGFNAGLSDSMIEIGGVKICNGSVIDRFDELINPGHPIDPEITSITEISDEDVKDADNEENVVKRFKEWIGDLPLVAHNAKFDKSMLDMAYYKYKLGKLENPIIDTLMLSRVINRDSKKHSLKALGKLYKIDTGDDVDDEENTEGRSSSSSSIPIDRFAATRIKDVLVDGVSIIETVDNELYTKKVHKASKTEKVTVKVVYDENEEYIEDIALHPADNRVTINIGSVLSVDISIYVGQHHGADVDSENTALIFNKMLKQVEGIKTLNDFNNLKLLEELSFDNDKSKQEKIGELCSYKNYVREVLEDEEVDPKFGYPFIKYGNKDYVWRYEWCHDDNLQMYENIPSKTFTEHLANVHDNFKHVTMIAKTKEGLKNLFKLVSFANSNFLQVNATIPRKLIDEYREGLLVGSACVNGEIFNLALTRCDEDLIEAMKWYDYIEVQPVSNYEHLLRYHDVNSKEDLEKVIEKIIRCAKEAGKPIVATGDVHQIRKEDLIYREIIVNQNVPGKGRHPLAKFLSGKDKVSVNLTTIDKVLNNERYNDIDKKVLKYIYVLTNLESLPITLNTITNIYQVDKNNPSEEIFKDKKQDKSEIIQESLNKLTNYSIIECNFENYHYCLNDANTKFKKTPIAESGHIPNQYFKTTNEMLDDFSFLDKKLAREIVIDNPKKILDSIDEFEVVVYPEKPFSPIIEHSQETCRDLVYEKAHSMYGDPLPGLIEERIAQEFYGDSILNLVREDLHIKHPKYTDEKIDEIFLKELHKVIMSGYDGVVKVMSEKLIRDEGLDEKEAIEKAKAGLGGIIGGGFDVIYLIAQKLVKHSNDEGYLVGSRGSVGSSFVATMMGITECNGLPPHYYCPNCQHSEFEDEEGNKYTVNYSSGYDLPEKECPKCKTKMIHQGNDMPFATFLGFNADKVPDIDLNFSGDNQASAHEYTKVLFGTDNVYRAGTISTVADKTAIGFALGYFEEEEYNKLKIEARSYGIDIPTKDDLKKKGIIKSNHNSIDIERISLGCIDVKRTTGQHPGGIVVVPGYKDVFDFTPFQYPADDPTVAWRTTHFDYHAIDADLLKLDILGHDDPTVLRMLQDLTGVDVTTIDLGDKDTMSIFTGPEILGVKKEDLRGLTRKDGTKYCPTGTLGVPEFGTSFLLGMLEETKPTTFAELIKISGLSHGTDVWLGNARDLCTPDENGDIRVPFKNVIGCRDDIMVNLIQWGMKPSKAFKIMEFVRKGKASKDPVGWAEHVKSMQEANIPDWYIASCEKIKYMFPKAHATAYVTSAFRIAWFKVHMPIYYYAAYFSIRCNQFDVSTMILGERAIRYRIDELEEKKALREASNKEEEICDVLYICLEMTARGFRFENIDITKSDANKFLVTEDKKGLIIPFSALDGLGDAVAKTIIKERKKSPFYSIEDLQSRGKVSKTLIDKMKEMHVLDELPESNQLSLF